MPVSEGVADNLFYTSSNSLPLVYLIASLYYNFTYNN